MNFYKIAGFLCVISIITGWILAWPPEAIAFLALSSFIFNIRGTQEQTEKKIDELLEIVRGCGQQ